MRDYEKGKRERKERIVGKKRKRGSGDK